MYVMMYTYLDARMFTSKLCAHFQLLLMLDFSTVDRILKNHKLSEALDL